MAMLEAKSVAVTTQKQGFIKPKNVEVLEGGKKMEQSKDKYTRSKYDSEFGYDVIEDFGAISEESNGWQKRFRLISWNGRPEKYDIREWQLDEDRMKKGITLTKEECKALKKILEKIEFEEE